MGIYSGISALIDYSGAATAGDAIDLLLGALPDPETTSTSGAKQGVTETGAEYAGYLDEMSVIALVQLRVELLALKAEVGTFNTAV